MCMCICYALEFVHYDKENHPYVLDGIFRDFLRSSSTYFKRHNKITYKRELNNARSLFSFVHVLYGSNEVNIIIGRARLFLPEMIHGVK